MSEESKLQRGIEKASLHETLKRLRQVLAIALAMCDDLVGQVERGGKERSSK